MLFFMAVSIFKCFLILLSIFFSPHLIVSQNIILNYPLKVGNIFVFTDSSSNSNYLSFMKCTVTKDTTINNKQYFEIDRFPFYYYGSMWYRFDSLSGRFLYYNSETNCSNYFHESLKDSLWARLGDSVKQCSAYLNKCSDTNSITIFGHPEISRSFTFNYYAGIRTSHTFARYVSKFGLITFEEGGSSLFGSSDTRFLLVGCVLNDTVYGDTTNYIIGNQKYYLFQNYPNPFNPITVIKYEITQIAMVTIKVFDTLGKEVKNLVDEFKPPGIYSISFDGTNLASGIYFYVIEVPLGASDTFIESKKMVLVK